jgi:hypothetical protein
MFSEAITAINPGSIGHWPMLAEITTIISSQRSKREGAPLAPSARE